ncbi:MAG: DNA-directed RNA polymerase subunit A', partial [Candidatus Diapherotrites archaeon]|nr:DNA-directed RNA polymerase subunit A' [Candidatus Diapherotrites archaeon]
VNFAARSTITPDPYLSINELGVPRKIAEELTVPEFVTEVNKKAIEDLIKKTEKVKYIIRPNGSRRKVTEEFRKEILEELATGYKIERELQDGDIVLFNRQPSLHRISMMAHNVKVMNNKTFRLNPIVCKPYNADFDGDEMNMHVPQTEEGKAEARELMFVQDQIISPRHGGPVIILDEDGVSGSFMLTMRQAQFSKDEAMKILYEMGETDLPKGYENAKIIPGKAIFSTVLPKDLNLEYKSKTAKLIERAGICKDCNAECGHDAYIVIKNGELVSGVIDSASLGEGGGSLVDTLAKTYPKSVLRIFYDKLSRATSYIVTRKGMTASLDEYQVSDAVEKIKKKAIAEEIEEADKLLTQYKKGTLEHVPGRTLDESFELMMMRLGFKTKEQVQKQLMKEKIETTLSDKPEYNTSIMMLAGSRGNPLNLTNMAGFWGQAAVREGRPKRGFTNRLIAINKKDDVGVFSGGFIQHNFMEGMDPREYFYHSIGGRQGEVDTGVSTKVSGYLYRRLANSLKDLVIAHDKTVRTSSKDIIQFNYGEDGVFPMHTDKGKTLPVNLLFKKLFSDEKK